MRRSRGWRGFSDAADEAISAVWSAGFLKARSENTIMKQDVAISSSGGVAERRAQPCPTATHRSKQSGLKINLGQKKPRDGWSRGFVKRGKVLFLPTAGGQEQAQSAQGQERGRARLGDRAGCFQTPAHRVCVSPPDTSATNSVQSPFGSSPLNDDRNASGGCESSTEPGEFVRPSGCQVPVNGPTIGI